MSDEGKLQIVGTCGEISERNGWTAFAVDVPGKQYPVKLSTKVEAIITEARAVGGEVATWTYKESQGGENPNKPGTFYTNRYLEGAVAGATAEAQAASDTPAPTASGSPQQSSTHTALPAGDRERSIIRQTCIKAACELYGGKGSTDDPDDDYALAVMQAADRFERWIMRDLEPDDNIPF